MLVYYTCDHAAEIRAGMHMQTQSTHVHLHILADTRNSGRASAWFNKTDLSAN